MISEDFFRIIWRREILSSGSIPGDRSSKGVGQLMAIAVDKGRSTRKNLKIGICGEHGGEPKSVEFCHSLGFNYVSCSPFRVPNCTVGCSPGCDQAISCERFETKKSFQEKSNFSGSSTLRDCPKEKTLLRQSFLFMFFCILFYSREEFFHMQPCQQECRLHHSPVWK